MSINLMTKALKGYFEGKKSNGNFLKFRYIIETNPILFKVRNIIETSSIVERYFG